MIEVESSDVARQYSKVFEVIFMDGEVALFDPEVEPVIKEAVDTFHANPSTHDRRVRALALDGDGFQFLTSDVLTTGWREVSGAEFSMLYPLNVRMFWLWDGVKMQLYYLVHERDILGVIR